MPAARIGIVEDDSITGLMLSEQAKRHGFLPLLMSNGSEVRQRCAMAQGGPPWDVLILDLGLPDCDGLDLLRDLKREYPEIPCLVLTARDRAADAISAIRSGAIEYAVKPFDPEEFFRLARAAYDRSRVEQATSAGVSPAWCGLGFPWKSKAMIGVDELFRHALTTRSPVLIVGEPGVGRYALARRIHSAGPGGKRSELAEVECESLDEGNLNLMISGGEVVSPGLQEIRTIRRGLFSRSLPSTLLLCGIENLPSVCQTTLCKAMESGTGNCRVIAVTGLTFEQLIALEHSSHDLLYLLAAIRITIPGLRLRREDVTPLFDKVLSDVCVGLGIRRPGLTRRASAWVRDHDWPGNIAELKWILNDIMLREPGREIDTKDLEVCSAAWLADREVGGQGSEGRRLDDLERVALIEALKLSGGNRRRVAAKLGVSLRTVYNMLERHGLKGRL